MKGTRSALRGMVVALSATAMLRPRQPIVAAQPILPPSCRREACPEERPAAHPARRPHGTTVAVNLGTTSVRRTEKPGKTGFATCSST